MDEDVQFTVYRPSAVLVDRWSWLLVFAHTTEGSAEEPDPLAEVRRQAEGVLGAQASAYGTLSADSTGPLRRGSTLLVEPWLDGATFNPPTVELRWEEPVHRADFRFRVGADAPAIARGGVRIFVGAVVVGELSLSVRVGERPEPRPLRTSARRFRKVFASYSHADTEVVEAVASAVQLLGDEYLIDSHDLRSGEDWQQRIGELIDDADVFQLFWSSNALQSHYVLAECRHALALRREGFIRPVYWQDPFPEDPTPGPPAAADPPAPLLPPGRNRGARSSGDRAPPRRPLSAASPRPRRPLLRRPRSAPPVPPARPSTAGSRAIEPAPVDAWPPGGRSPRRRSSSSASAAPPSGPETTAAANSAPATTRLPDGRAGTRTSVRRRATEPVSSDDAAFDRAVAYLGGLAVAQDPSCRLSAANPALGEVGALEEVGVDCTLTAASGASVDFRSVVLRPGVTVQQYLDGLAAAPGLQVVGGSLPSDPDGPYLDIGGRLPDGRTYSCRAWGRRRSPPTPTPSPSRAAAPWRTSSTSGAPPMSARRDGGPHRLQVGRAGIAPTR